MDVCQSGYDYVCWTYQCHLSLKGRYRTKSEETYIILRQATTQRGGDLQCSSRKGDHLAQKPMCKLTAEVVGQCCNVSLPNVRISLVKLAHTAKFCMAPHHRRTCWHLSLFAQADTPNVHPGHSDRQVTYLTCRAQNMKRMKATNSRQGISVCSSKAESTEQMRRLGFSLPTGAYILEGRNLV